MSVRRGVGVLVAAVVAVSALMVGRQGRAPAAGSDDAPDMTAAHQAAMAGVSRDLVAARTVDRLVLFRTGNGPSSMTLASDEVTALVTELLPGLLPTGVHDAQILVQDGDVMLRARLATGSWAGTRRLRTVMSVLPDTVRAEVDGDLVRVGRRLRLHVSAARVHGLPLPAPVIDALVAELPLSARQAEGPILEVVLPDGIGDVRVVGDRLILYAAEPILDRAVDGQDGS